MVLFRVLTFWRIGLWVQYNCDIINNLSINIKILISCYTAGEYFLCLNYFPYFHYIEYFNRLYPLYILRIQSVTIPQIIMSDMNDYLQITFDEPKKALVSFLIMFKVRLFEFFLNYVAWSVRYRHVDSR